VIVVLFLVFIVKGGNKDPKLAGGTTRPTTATPSSGGGGGGGGGTPTATPTVQPPSPTPTIASTPTSPEPTPSEEGRHFDTNVCHSVDDNYECVGAFAYNQGWTLGPKVKKYEVWLRCTRCKEGDVVEFRYVNTKNGATFQKGWTFNALTKDDEGFSTYTFYDTHSTAANGKRHRGRFRIDFIVNGAPIDLDGPTTVTIQ
jgi:hypothetical protein